jgi:PKD repeat protein
MNMSVAAKKIIVSFLLLILIGTFYSCQKENSPNDDPPVAGFTYTSVITVPVTIQFVNTSTTPAGVTAAYAWDFGDGITANTQNATHTYLQLGAYNVRLTQTPSSGMADSVTYVIVLSETAGPSGSSNRLHGIQTVNFNYVITAKACVANFINTSTNAGSYLWKFGDGATSTTDSSHVTHTYFTSGSYHVNLTGNSSGGTDTSGATITF